MKALRPLALAALALAARAQDPGRDFVRAGAPGGLPAPLAAAVDQLDAARMGATLAALADPARQGRGLGTPGLAASVAQVRRALAATGFRPLGPSWEQAVPLREVAPAPGRVDLRIGGRTFAFRGGRDAVLPAVAPGTLAGDLVFAGFGIQEPSLGHDDYRGLSVRGKVVVFRAGTPAGEAWRTGERKARWDSDRPADRYDARLALLEKLGARAAIALEPGLDQRLAAGQEPPLPYFLAAPGVPGSGEPPLARLTPNPDLLRALEAGGPGRATLAVRGRLRTLREVNLLGRLEGSDPALRREAVLLGAHLDHLGMPAGRVHPGADDNSSGVAALLELARVLGQAPVRPRRTLLVAFWTGEEEGKFGSGHYVRHPRWPLEATRAYLNLDMIGHPWTAADLQDLARDTGLGPGHPLLQDLDLARFAEPGLSDRDPALGPILRQAGLGTGMNLHLDWTDGRHGGSDYRDFARRGLPFVRFFGSYFPAYHTPGDTADQVDPAQVQRMARLVLATAWLLADAPEGWKGTLTPAAPPRRTSP